MSRLREGAFAVERPLLFSLRICRPHHSYIIRRPDRRIQRTGETIPNVEYVVPTG